MATVYWLTGLSGAGKTTIGTLLYQYIKQSAPNTVLLDGDVLRQVFGDDLGYSREDRLKSAMRNARLCALLQSQNINVVCCTISMFHSVRDWNRAHINQYKEIYLKVLPQTLRMRNQKDLYGGKATDVAGLQVTVEEPQDPELTILNDGQMTPEEVLKLIIMEFKL